VADSVVGHEENDRRVGQALPVQAIETVRANRRNYARSKPTRLTEVVKLGFNVE